MPWYEKSMASMNGSSLFGRHKTGDDVKSYLTKAKAFSYSYPQIISWSFLVNLIKGYMSFE